MCKLGSAGIELTRKGNGNAQIDRSIGLFAARGHDGRGPDHRSLGGAAAAGIVRRRCRGPLLVVQRQSGAGAARHQQHCGVAEYADLPRRPGSVDRVHARLPHHGSLRPQQQHRPGGELLLYSGALDDQERELVRPDRLDQPHRSLLRRDHEHPEWHRDLVRAALQRQRAGRTEVRTPRCRGERYLAARPGRGLENGLVGRLPLSPPARDLHVHHQQSLYSTLHARHLEHHGRIQSHQ